MKSNLSIHFKRLVFYTINTFVKILKRIIKTDSRVIISGYKSFTFTDNSAHLILLMRTFGSSRILWITDSLSLRNQLVDKNFNAALRSSFYAWYWAIKSSIHIICDAPNTSLPYFAAGSIKINLWHGTPVKNILELKLGYKNPMFAGEWYEHNTYILCNAAKHKASMAKAFNLHTKHILLAKYPRLETNDCSLSLPDDVTVQSIEQLKQIKSKALIGYFPTWRIDHSIDPSREMVNLAKYLPLQGINIALKCHGSADETHEFKSICTNIIRLPSHVDLSSILFLFDIIVTDYSGLIYDCIYKNIPTICYCPDLSNFSRSPGFVLSNWNEECEIVHDIQELSNSIEQLINSQFDNTCPHKDQLRSKMKNLPSILESIESLRL